MEPGEIRVRAGWLGLPAVITSIFGIGVMAVASSTQETTLLTRYQALAERSNTEFQDRFFQFVKLSQEEGRRRAGVSPEVADGNKPNEEGNEPDAGSSSESGAEVDSGNQGVEPDREQLRRELLELRKNEILYLEKMISIQPTNSELKFKYAQAHTFYDQNRRLALLNALAPIDEQGYAPAQLELALLNVAESQRFPAARLQLLRAALQHADQCLIQDKDNLEALKIRATALVALQQYEKAYAAYTRIVAERPEYFQELIQVNNLRGESATDNNIILQSARIELSKKLTNPELNLAEWETLLGAYANCLLRLNEMSALREELVKYTAAAEGKPDAELRKQTVQRLLAEALLNRSRQTVAKISTANDARGSLVQESLAMLQEVAAIFPQSPSLKNVVTSLLISAPEVREELLKLYDPFSDPAAPYFVLEQLGTDALSKDNFSEAITILERARRLAPDNPMVLNNLAYAYLNPQQSDPKRALYLAEAALKAVEKSTTSSPDALFQSGLKHTYATALMQLGRFSEAAAAFQDALAGRPEHLGILQSLVTCFEQIDAAQAEIYRRRLAEVKAKTSATTPSTDPSSTPSK